MRNKQLAVMALVSLVAVSCGSDDDDPQGSDATVIDDTGAGGDSTVAGSAPPTASAPGSTEPGAGSTRPGTTGAPSQGEAGGSATYGVEQEYTTYNNDTSLDNLFANTEVLNAVQPSTFIIDSNNEYVLASDLLESVELTSEDPQVVEYVINPEAVWSDDDPIDCDDFYLEWLSGNGRAGDQVDDEGNEVLDDNGEPIPVFDAASTTGFEDIESVECSNNGFTVTTTYSQPFPDYPSLFSNIMPAHIVEAQAGVADVTTATDPADLQALGEFWNNGFRGFDPEIAVSGSYYGIDSVNPGETVVLTRNEQYWGEPGLLDEIVFRLVPRASDLPAALANGDVQVIAPQPEPDLLAQLEGQPGLVTEVVPGTTFEHLDFNQANPMLADVNVRKAIALCIDRQELIDTLVAPVEPDTEVLNNRMFVPFQDDYVDNGAGYEAPDVEGASSLLEESGWTMGSDGIYEKDGERLSLRVGRIEPNPRRQKVVELIGDQCRPAGIELTDDGTEDFNAVRLPRSDYDIALFAWVAQPALSSNRAVYASDGNQNWNNASNEETDRLLAEAASEFDPATRVEALNEADALLWEDMVTLPLFQQPNLVARSEALEGVVPNDPLGPTWNAEEWSLSA